VEKTLLSHPAVLEVAVVPVPDERWGEVPKALVVLKANTQANEIELIEHCRLHLSHYKCPRSIEYLESLPRTGTGKVLKRDLRKKYWQGRETIRPEFDTPETKDCADALSESSSASVGRRAARNK
jgi:fatty-acyl-CoA synthase